MELEREKHILLPEEISKWETITLYTLYLLSALIPLVIGHPQFLVGSAINFLIIFASLKYGFKKTLPICILPSIVATTTGLLFNGATIFLVYLMPFIMISNCILSYLSSLKKNPLTIFLGILLKAGFLYSITLLLMKWIGLPSIFLTSMGYVQLYTALIGGTVAYATYLSIRKAI